MDIKKVNFNYENVFDKRFKVDFNCENVFDNRFKVDFNYEHIFDNRFKIDFNYENIFDKRFGRGGGEEVTPSGWRTVRGPPNLPSKHI